MTKLRWAVVFVFSLTLGCADWWPHQGCGTLYIYEYGESDTVRVRSVDFISSRMTVYIDENGQRHETGAPTHYVGD